MVVVQVLAMMEMVQRRKMVPEMMVREMAQARNKKNNWRELME
jgi:hypothetical protein